MKHKINYEKLFKIQFLVTKLIFYEFYCIFLNLYNHIKRDMQPILNKKYEIINIDKVLNRYENNKQFTKTIYPNHNSSLNYKRQRKTK
jgi:hypothetical protein